MDIFANPKKILIDKVKEKILAQSTKSETPSLHKSQRESGDALKLPEIYAISVMVKSKFYMVFNKQL